MDDLELLYRLDHNHAVAQTICDFAEAEPDGRLVLDGEVDMVAVGDILFFTDPATRAVTLVSGGGVLNYRGVKVYYGPCSGHPSLRSHRRLCVGQPVSGVREVPYATEEPEQPRGLLRRLLGR